MNQLPFVEVSALMKEGRREEALVVAQDWAGNTYNAWAYAAIATVRMSLKAPEEALTAINAAVDWEPEEPGLLFIRARVLFAAGHWALALADCKEVVRLAIEARAGHHVDRCLVLGAACHLELGDPEAALSHLGLARADSAVFAGRVLRTQPLVTEARRRLGKE